MHPAPSVILFSTLSGLGLGFLFFLGIGHPDMLGWHAFGAFFIAYALAVGGLVSSTFHLGNPQRALKAFTQWRTSWLSREAWVSVTALTLMGLFALGQVFLGGGIHLLGTIAAILCLGTVFTTSMIYAQIKAVPRWHHWTTVLQFMGFAITGGAILAGHTGLAITLLVLLGLAITYAWHVGDTSFATRGATMNSATGLQGGSVRAFEPPHTGSNYLMHEMIHLVGRKHCEKLKLICILFAIILPAVTLMICPGHIGIMAAAILHLIGAITHRWLFFAEAEHVVGLYYGAR